MRIMWFNYGILPEACAALGYKADVGGGWIPSMLSALLDVDSELEFCVACLDPRPCDVNIGRVRYVSFGEKRTRFSYKRVPNSIKNQIHCLVKDFHPDVIHVQGTEYFFGALEDDVYCNVPVVVSLQGILSGIWPKMTGELTWRDVWRDHINLRFFLKGQTLFRERDFCRNVRAEQERALIQRRKFFIGRTDWDHNWITYFNPRATYFHLNENMRSEFFGAKREMAQVRKHSIYCGAAASCALKGGHLLLQAVASLSKEFPDIELRIAASEERVPRKRPLKTRLKDTAYWMHIRRIVRKLGLSRHVRFLPSLSASEVVHELQRAELFVLPSLCENSPNSIGEAMLIGTPVISTFVGGVPSIIKESVEGKLVPSGDPAALAGAIRNWFEHPDEAESCAVEATKTALARHNSRENAMSLMRIYTKILADHA